MWPTAALPRSTAFAREAIDSSAALSWLWDSGQVTVCLSPHVGNATCLIGMWWGLRTIPAELSERRLAHGKHLGNTQGLMWGLVSEKDVILQSRSHPISILSGRPSLPLHRPQGLGGCVVTSTPGRTEKQVRHIGTWGVHGDVNPGPD